MDDNRVRLHAGQSQVFKDLFINQSTLHAAVCCSRGWGKSYFAATAAATAIHELMELDARVPNKLVHIIAPTYEQVTDIYYPILAYDLGLEEEAVASSRDRGRFIFEDGVELRLLSYESVERMRGKGSYFTVWDEISSCVKGVKPQEAWESTIKPAMVTRWGRKKAIRYGARSPARSLLISTPKGFNYFYDLHRMQEVDKDFKSYTYDYTTSPFLDPEEIEKDREVMDPIKFASEYLASFKESGNNVFYCFDRNIHVREDLPYFLPPTMSYVGETVHVGIDFNVGLQCTNIFAVRGEQIHILEEMSGHPDTETLAKYLTNKFKGHKIVAYPDPSGKARKTSAPVGQTDFSILESAGIAVVSRPAAPPIVDSVNAVNRMLLSASSKVRLFVHPRCKGVIKSLERTKWVDGNPNTAAIDKKEGIEHFSDSVRYPVEILFPVVSNRTVVVRGKNF